MRIAHQNTFFRMSGAAGDKALLLLTGEAVIGTDGSFAGFKGTAEPDKPAMSASSAAPSGMVDQMLDSALRSPSRSWALRPWPWP